MGKIVAFSNQKGGVGKTTTCVNLAACLAEKGKRVLLVDLDPQGNATTGLGRGGKDLGKSVYHVLLDGCAAAEAVVSSPVPNLSLLPASVDLAGAEVELVYVKNRERALADALGPVRGEYDYVFVDCPPSLGLLTINALAAADAAVVPVQGEYYALEGLSRLVDTVRLVVGRLNPALKIEGVVLTMFDRRALISRQIADEIRKYFGEAVYRTVIPRNVRVTEAQSRGVPVILHDPACAGSKAYRELAGEFLRREERA